MLYTVAVVLLIAWLLGIIGTYTMGGLVHVHKRRRAKERRTEGPARTLPPLMEFATATSINTYRLPSLRPGFRGVPPRSSLDVL